MENKKWHYEKSREKVATFLSWIKAADMEYVLDDLLTPQEISEIAERVELLSLVASGKTQRQIAQDMGISVTTVNRWSRILKYGTGHIRDYI